jgi:hypothetical protein
MYGGLPKNFDCAGGNIQTFQIEFLSIKVSYFKRSYKFLASFMFIYLPTVVEILTVDLLFLLIIHTPRFRVHDLMHGMKVCNLMAADQ